MAIRGANVRRVVTSDHVVGLAFASPAVLLIIVFGLIPIAWSALLSFQKANLLSPPHWVGLANYRALPKDPYSAQSMVHSAIYTVLFVPLSVVGGLLTAIALDRPIRGIRVYRTAVFVPVVVSTIATVIIFLWVFDPNFGLANWLLAKVGLGPFAFFTSSNGALYSIVAMTVVAGTATYVPVFYLYKRAFQQCIAGYAAAIAYVLFAVILVLTVAQLLVGKRMVHYT